MQINAQYGQCEYQRRNPQATVLYKVIQDNFLQVKENLSAHGKELAPYVEEEFNKFLKCGVLSEGFARVKCTATAQECGKEYLVPFSCKCRGFCLSCIARKQATTARHLVDNAFFGFPIRQWVVSFPFNIRFILAFNPEIMSNILLIFKDEVTKFYQREAQNIFIEGAQGGMVVCIQRFGSTLNLNLHFHLVAYDGYFFIDSLLGKNLRFRKSIGPTKDELDQINLQLIARVTKFLNKNGYLSEDPNLNPLMQGTFEAQDEARAAAIQNKFAFAQSHGSKITKIGQAFFGEYAPLPGIIKLSNINGFSLHANTAVEKYNETGKENLISYILRPPFANGRLSLTGPNHNSIIHDCKHNVPNNSNAQEEYSNVILHLKKPFSDGTYAVSFTPAQFIERLIAIVPPPKINFVRYYGVLANRSKLRSLWLKLLDREYLKRVNPLALNNSDGPDSVADEGPTTHELGGGGKEEIIKTRRKRYIPWAELLKQVFNIDVTQCSACGSRVKIIAFIKEAKVIEKILNHLNFEVGSTEFRPPLYCQMSIFSI